MAQGFSKASSVEVPRASKVHVAAAPLARNELPLIAWPLRLRFTADLAFMAMKGLSEFLFRDSFLCLFCFGLLQRGEVVI